MTDREDFARELIGRIFEAIETELEDRKERVNRQIQHHAEQGRADRAGAYAIWLAAIEDNRRLVLAMFRREMIDAGLDAEKAEENVVGGLPGIQGF